MNLSTTAAKKKEIHADYLCSVIIQMDLIVKIFTVTMGLQDLIVHHECCAQCVQCEFSK